MDHLNHSQSSINPYARPTPGNCYRCGKPGHRSNVSPDCRMVNLVEDVPCKVIEDKDYGDHNEVEYV